MGRYRTRAREAAKNTQADLANKKREQLINDRKLEITEDALRLLELRGGPSYVSKIYRDYRTRQIKFEQSYYKKNPDPSELYEIERSETAYNSLVKKIERHMRDNEQPLVEVVPNVSWDIHKDCWKRWQGSWIYKYGSLKSITN